MKRIIAVLLACVLTATCLPANRAFADSGVRCAREGKMGASCLLIPMSVAQREGIVMASALLRSGVRGLVGSQGNLVVLGSLGGVRSVSPLVSLEGTPFLRVRGCCVCLQNSALAITCTASSETWVQGSVIATRRVRDYPLLLMSPLLLRVRLSLWCWRGLRWSGWIFVLQRLGCGLTR